MIWNSYPKPYVVFIANHPHMQLALSLSFVKLLWPLVRFISYSHDQDHIHISTTCYASTLESKIPSIHKIKLHVHVWHHSLSKIYQGYGAMQKEKNKRCIPKEGMPHATTCQKKRRKDAYPKKVYHVTSRKIHQNKLLAKNIFQNIFIAEL